ncbi:MAG: toll/interleukin-1 receptor domain-containing protein [Bacteroidetes bacterium]|nr:MAG: toll/interleukin-1 receptor domain-containing protein [Bacteroidota bacterium]
MKEQIQQLIAEGRTEEALTMLAQQSSDALLLQARYNAGKKQYNMGLIEFSEWQRTQAQINYAALELANSLKSEAGGAAAAGGGAGAPAANPAPAAAGKKAFISYNHGDIEVGRKVHAFLAEQGVNVIRDEEDMPAGMSIMEFIQQSIKNCDAVVSIVSSKSLQSGWVGQESAASMYAVWLADKKFIPVKLDDVAFDIDFQIAAQETLLKNIEELETKIEKLRKLGGDSRAFDDDRNRLFELKNNLGQIIQRLKSVLMLDINGDNFEPSMKKVLERIQKN